MSESKPSAGAKRAAEKIWESVGYANGNHTFESVAKIIDSESGLPELLEACEAAMRLDYTHEHRGIANILRAAIEKAKP